MSKLFSNIKFKDASDLGWSSSVDEDEGRVLNKDGSFNLIRKGEQTHIYHLLITMPWWKFFALIFLAFTLLNGFFASVYFIVGIENIEGIESKGFIHNFFNVFHFSVQTMTTVGYGAMHPKGMLTGIIASFEALLGLLSFALISGLMYGRFSNPKAEIRFAKKILITNINGKLSLQARIANKLSHDLFDVHAKILMLHNEKLENGSVYKRYRSLPLEMENVSFLPMNWTLVHPINEDSPLVGLTHQDMLEQKVEFLLIITAFDDTFAQWVHSKTSYMHEDIIYQAKWDKTYYVNPEGCRVFELDRLDNFTKI
jgi:inward rectifier potassium channel